MKRLKQLRIIIPILLITALLLPQAAFAAQTISPYASSIKIVNNAAGTPDTITVTDLNVADIVKIYADPTTTTTIGTGTVAASTSTVVVSITQLGVISGTVFVSVTTSPNSESKRTSKTYAAEPQTSALDSAQITVTNNPTGNADSVDFVNLTSGDFIKVYSSPTDTTTIGTGTVGAGQSSISISISQLGAAAGSIYASRTTNPTVESIRTVKSYSAEAATSSISPSDITVTNLSTGTSDIIVVRNVQNADIIKVYATKTDSTPIATVTATTTTATLSVSQLGTASGSVYVTLTRGTMVESSRISKTYAAETASSTPQNNIDIVNNNTGTNDVITIDNLNPTDIIRVYATKTSTPALATITANKNLLPPFLNWTLHANSSITASYGLRLVATAGSQLSYYDVPVLPSQSYAFQITNSNSGTVNVKTLDSAGATITTKLTTTTAAPTVIFTTESNASYIRVELTSTAAGTFNWSNPQVELGSATSTYEDQAMTTTKNIIPQFSKWTSLHVNTTISSPYNLKLTASAAGQSSYVRVRVTPSTQYTYSLTHNGLVSITSLSSSLTTLTSHYTNTTAQSGTFTTPVGAAYVNFLITNVASGSFTFTEPQLEAGVVATNFETLATPLVTGSVKISQLGTTAGSVYITITTPGTLESKRVVKSYSAESATDGPSLKSIKITNNKIGTNDNIAVYGLAVGDVIKVYSSKIITSTMATATVGAGTTVGTISISQLGTTSGTLYLTVTTNGKTESNRTARSYAAE
jgi:hypothetical protein